MREWLLHMGEDRRVQALSLVEATLAVLSSRKGDPQRAGRRRSPLTVVRLPDRRSGADVRVSRGAVTLRAPLSPTRDLPATHLTGPARGIGDVAVDAFSAALATLEGWRSALTRPADARDAAEVREIGRAASLLLRGAAEDHRPGWELATLQSSTDGGHEIMVFDRTTDARQRHLRFAEGRAGRGTGGMSEALAREIGRIVGDRPHAHVVADRRRGGFRLRFDETPLFVVSADGDPMATLRALAALPPGACLLPTA